ncbi:MAG TPA: hypothetical protein ENN68_04070 [Methanomicrobia archaeon]|nr:hypothetical protein [Methanomicrobia archaeon]
MIRLFFESFTDKEIEERVGEDYEIIRLTSHIRFRTPTGWSKIYDAIVDTGAHTPVIPFNIWNDLDIDVMANYELKGLNPRRECAIPSIIGKVVCILLDDQGNQSEEIETTSFLAYTDKVPLIVEFKNVLPKFKVCFNYANGDAYLMEENEWKID